MNRVHVGWSCSVPSNWCHQIDKLFVSIDRWMMRRDIMCMGPMLMMTTTHVWLCHPCLFNIHRSPHDHDHSNTHTAKCSKEKKQLKKTFIPPSIHRSPKTAHIVLHSIHHPAICGTQHSLCMTLAPNCVAFRLLFAFSVRWFLCTLANCHRQLVDERWNNYYKKRRKKSNNNNNNSNNNHEGRQAETKKNANCTGYRLTVCCMCVCASTEHKTCVACTFSHRPHSIRGYFSKYIVSHYIRAYRWCVCLWRDERERESKRTSKQAIPTATTTLCSTVNDGRPAGSLPPPLVYCMIVLFSRHPSKTHSLKSANCATKSMGFIESTYV